MNAIDRRLAEALISRADALISEFDWAKPGSPLKTVLMKAKRDAVEAISALIEADPANASSVMQLQNEARRYGDLVRYIRDTISEADDAHFALEEEDRQEILQAMMSDATRAAPFEEG